MVVAGGACLPGCNLSLSFSRGIDILAISPDRKEWERARVRECVLASERVYVRGCCVHGKKRRFGLGKRE